MPEDQWFDRKSVRISPTKLAEGIVAFANAEGGTILIGLSDGKVEGTDGQVQHRNDLIQAAIDHTVPPVRTRHELIECRNQRGGVDHLLAIHVVSSEGVHATGADQVFLRVGDESRRLNFVQRQELLYDKGQAHFDGSLVTGISMDDLDQDVLAQYVETIGHNDPQRALIARGLATKSGLTAGAYLLFGVHPQDIYPNAHAYWQIINE